MGCSVYGRNPKHILSVHWILIALLMILQFASAICICIYGVEESDILRRDLHETFIRLVMRWDEDPRASRIMRKIQEYVGCCGADGSDDYIQYFKPVPDECRDRITGVEYSYGCEQQLAWWLEPLDSNDCWSVCISNGNFILWDLGWQGD
ncbi:unnamed protein product [Lepeophtheirus salmonis]|uniref:(salmon louse) hypothetical protein n=1 Tax=Lepeophtheirus salmonis TaxID=72036 RepID=A0A7R8CKI1_LEPSM|nr:unnamed protein product [Lepeophtheirus salmonis]CAF2848042.1 unnamed protein product [Lepeophtheirus salmonis]